MKKIIHLIGIFTIVLFSNIGNAQIVNIPDVNFKGKLLEASTSNSIAKDINGDNMVIDVNSDGEIQVSEALAVYQLNVPNSNIEDLTGIEAFINLTRLSCHNNYPAEIYNNLTEIDISNN